MAKGSSAKAAKGAGPTSKGGAKAPLPQPGEPHFPGWPARHDAKGPSGDKRYNGPKPD